MSLTSWDWDEMLFCLGLRDYDVAAFRPHPPGFPLFMLAAKIIRPLFDSDFHALQAISLASACALFPLAFLLARALRFSFATSFLSSLLFVFFPTVWFYGGTGLSDVTGIALSLAAAALLFIGAEGRPGVWFAGCVALGIAGGVRPQTILFGAAPFLTSAWAMRRAWKRVAGGTLIVLLIVAASYTGAALASSSVAAYRGSVGKLGTYLRNVDSFHNPHRPPVRTLIPDFLLHPMAGGRLAIIVDALAIAGLGWGLATRRGPRVLLAAATFLPFAIFALFMLDPHSVHRYGTAYLALYALLAAHGMDLLTRRLPRSVPIALLLLMTVRYAWWTWPAIDEVRRTPSPPIAAMSWIKQHRLHTKVDGSLVPWQAYYVIDDSEPHQVFATEGIPLAASATHFIRPRGRTWEIARQRYFEVTVAPLSDDWTFGDEWYDLEYDQKASWQWMGHHASATLPAAGETPQLTLTFECAAPNSPLELRVNGAVLDRVTCRDEPMTQHWPVTTHNKPATLELTCEKTVRVGKDPRELGLRLLQYEWR